MFRERATYVSACEIARADAVFRHNAEARVLRSLVTNASTTDEPYSLGGEREQTGTDGGILMEKVGDYTVNVRTECLDVGGAFAYPEVFIEGDSVTQEALDGLGHPKTYFEGLQEQLAAEHALGALRPLLEKWTRERRHRAGR
jgi:hypothetical protein